MSRQRRFPARGGARPHRLGAILAVATLVGSLALAAGPAGAQPRLRGSAGWLETVNWYRAASGLPPVVEDPAWTAGITAHLKYLRLTPASFKTGEFANAHRENPDSPYFTTEGNAAGRSSNLTFGVPDERAAIDSWMGAPFHAIGILRPGLQKVAFARDPESGAAGLDVIRGLTGTSTRTTPVLFPGANSGTHLSAFRGESPDPRETCGFSSAGLPLIALLPQTPAATITADLTDPGGAVVAAPGPELCVVTAANFASTDTVYGPTGKDILRGSNAVLVIPRRALTGGRYVVRIHQSAQPDISWPFYVTGLAGTAIGAGEVMRVHVADTGGATVMGNLTVTEPRGPGFTTVYPCAEGRPLASNNNYDKGQTTPNFVIAQADPAGDICLFTSAGAHLLWDQVGQTSAFTASNATRKLDTRGGDRIAAGEVARVHVSETGATTVMGNLTVTEPDGPGFTTAYPCAEGRPLASNNNYDTGQTTPNFVIVRADSAGDICLFTKAAAHLLWDQVGQTGAFATANARRVFDSRAD